MIHVTERTSQTMTTTTPDQTTATKSSPASSADHGATRTALVTGASSGIGENTARKLQALGYVVYVRPAAPTASRP